MRQATAALVLAGWLALGTAVPAKAATAAPALMSTPRVYHFAVSLPDGGALVGGGSDGRVELATTERWEPETHAFRAAAGMSIPRSHAVAVALRDGRALVAGGVANDAGIATAEVYDPSADRWSPVGAMAVPRWDAVGVVLDDGKVLVAGGYTGVGDAATASAEVFDPQAGRWSRVAAMTGPRAGAGTMMLPDGRPLVAGGVTGDFGEQPELASTELFDPRTLSWAAGPPMAQPRASFVLARLPNGGVIAAGGVDLAGGFLPLNTGETFNAAAGVWQRGPALNLPHGPATGGVQANGVIIVAGGLGRPSARSAVTAEALRPDGSRWELLPQMHSRRSYAAFVGLLDGRGLITGGFAGASPTASADLYDLAAANPPADGPIHGMAVPATTLVLLTLTGALAVAVLLQARALRRSA